MDSLEPMLLRHVALASSDPGSLAGSFQAAWQAINDEGFVLEWFHKWQPLLAPHRPWQYALVTWQRMQGSRSSPEQLAGFMLKCLQQQQQQQQGSHQLTQQLGGLSISTAAQSSSQPQQQQQQQGVAEGVQEQELTQVQFPWLRCLVPKCRFEGVISCPPSCKPQPSTLRKAKQLLAQGTGLEALLQLCPASTSLLLTYAAQAGNAVLLRQLLALKSEQMEPLVYPQNYTKHGGFFVLLPTVQTAAAAAVRKRWPDALAMLLAARGANAFHVARPLLRLAAARGDAACLELLITCGAATETIRVGPEHLAVAASRTDDAAVGVVAVLLRDLGQKQQLAAKWMKHAYAAACRSSNAKLLLQLLQAAAAAAAAERQPQWQRWHRRHHTLAALDACAAAGNAAVWRQLMLWFSVGSAAAAGEDEDTQMEETAQPHAALNTNSNTQQEIAQTHAALRGFDLSRLTADDWVKLLHRVLPQPTLQQHQLGQTPAASQQQHKDAVDRCSMADLLWRCLQETLPASAAAVGQLLEASSCWQLLGDGLDSVLARNSVSKFTAAEWLRGRQRLSAEQQQQQPYAAEVLDVMSRTCDAAVAAAISSGPDALQATFQMMANSYPFTTQDRVLDATVALSEVSHAERLLWLQQRGLLYGASSKVLLLHTLLASAGVAAALGQTALAAQYVQQAHSLTCATRDSAASRAAVDPAELQQKQANKAASLVFYGRVVAACQAGSIEQLQQLEQLQHLARVLVRLANTEQPEFFLEPFATVQMFCAAPASSTAGFSAAAAAAAAEIPNVRHVDLLGAAAAGGGVDIPAVLQPEVSAAIAEPWIAEAAAAVWGACGGGGAAAADSSRYSAAEKLARITATSPPYSYNAAYALQLGDVLGVPVLDMQLQRLEQSSLTPLPRDNLTQHVAFLQLASHLQQQLQEAEQRCGPAPLWQLSLLKVFESYPEDPITADLEPALDIRRAVQDCIRVQDLPDAWVQQLVKTLAAAKHVPVSAGSGSPAAGMAAYAAGQLSLQKRRLGDLVAEAAVQQLRPQLLQWLLQQRGIWEEGLWLEDPGMPVVPAGPGGVERQCTQSEWLQHKSLISCPMIVGLQSTTAAVAGGGSAGAAAAAAAGVVGGVGSEVAAAAETALVLLQLQPTLHNNLLSSWICNNLRTGSSSSSNGGGCSPASMAAARVARATAVLSAVAAAANLPASARQVSRKALQKVVDACDADVLTALLLWSSRLTAWQAADPADIPMEE